MATVKLTLNYPTLDKAAGDTIEVSDQETADELVRNGSAVPFKAASKSDKG